MLMADYGTLETAPSITFLQGNLGILIFGTGKRKAWHCPLEGDGRCQEENAKAKTGLLGLPWGSSG